MKERVISYAQGALFILLGFLLAYLTQHYTKNQGVFLFFFPAIAITSWRGGFKPALAVTAVSSLLIAYFFFPQTTTSRVYGLLEIYLFFAEGILLSLLMNPKRHTTMISLLKNREKVYESTIDDLKHKYARAKQEIKSRDEFLSIASHELKTPLTSMLLQIQRALHNIKNVSLANFSVEDLLKMLESTERQSSRLSKMINDLLNVSLISTRKLDLELEEFNISQLTKDVVEGFSEKFAKEGYAPRVDIHYPVVGKWDKVRVEQAITNLISNAIKYGDKKPIAITLANHNANVRITVSDHGLGIPHDQKEKIFALFERGNMNDKRYKGLGVGLYISNEIVKAHNGKIEIKSKEGKGSSFTMELPLKPQAN
ncbi:MAG: HAMP domain-containing histidine kinase [Candidatus Levybacteria bacterium]|nr:HAMP domain-containing histidine kinase [Candidatus Levybacteria bacterium]